MISICFSGMDGAGKSTQGQKLYNRLLQLGVDVEFFHMGSEGKTVGSQSQALPVISSIHRTLRDLSGKGISRYIKLSTGLSYYFLDAWVSHFTHRKNYRNKVIIYDRYFFDFLAIFASNFPIIPWWVINVVKILPHCNVSIIMAASPQIAKERRPEHPIEDLERYFQIYQCLAHKLGISLIDGTRDLQTIEEEVNQHCRPIFEQLHMQPMEKAS